MPTPDAADEQLEDAGGPPGTGGGYFFSFSLPGLELEQRWQASDGVVL